MRLAEIEGAYDQEVVKLHPEGIQKRGIFKARMAWVKEALAEVGWNPDEDDIPKDTLQALVNASVRNVPEIEIGEQEDEQREIPKKPKVKTPPKNRRYHHNGQYHVKRDAEITEKQRELILGLADDYGLRVISMFAVSVGIEKWADLDYLTVDNVNSLNRGQASDLIGKLLEAQKAKEITKL